MVFLQQEAISMSNILRLTQIDNEQPVFIRDSSIQVLRQLTADSGGPTRTVVITGDIAVIVAESADDIYAMCDNK